MQGGGIVSPPGCPFNINHEIYSELIREQGIQDLNELLLAKAKQWCENDERLAELLVKAWLSGEQALQSWPILGWYQPGPITTQGRLLTRPLVPDFSRLEDSEREAFERGVFTLEWDIGRLNISFEGGIRIFKDEQMAWAVKQFDKAMLPQLELKAESDGKAHQ